MKFDPTFPFAHKIISVNHSSKCKGYQRKTSRGKCRNICISPWGGQRVLSRIQKLLTMKENNDM